MPAGQLRRGRRFEGLIKDGSRGQKSMHRAPSRDHKEPLPLALGQITGQRQPNADSIGLSSMGFAVSRFDPLVMERHRDAVKRPFASSGVQPDRNRYSRTERTQQEFEGCWPSVGAAVVRRLVADERVATNDDLLGEPFTTSNPYVYHIRLPHRWRAFAGPCHLLDHTTGAPLATRLAYHAVPSNPRSVETPFIRRSGA